ncbi:NAD(P)H-dependent oxidoreductase [Echinicola pacifica]|nr:NAD(P)H-dependent oxidoreductase [Echinicola pacifica]
MTNVFIINGGHPFAHSPGEFNATLLEKTSSYLSSKDCYAVQTSSVGEKYDVLEEVEKFKWADIIVYHTPIWWFQLPFGFKEYIDRVITAGHQRGIYDSDGRSSKNPAINYGTGGRLQGKKYIVTTSWNAPKEAFELEGEFFRQQSVDDSILFGFHRMNAFIGLERLASMHFHDVEKNADIPQELERYALFLEKMFS